MQGFGRDFEDGKSVKSRRNKLDNLLSFEKLQCAAVLCSEVLSKIQDICYLPTIQTVIVRQKIISIIINEARHVDGFELGICNLRNKLNEFFRAEKFVKLFYCRLFGVLAIISLLELI